MRRLLIPNAALVAGIALLLSGCSGETPTAPTTPKGGGTGSSCTTLITMSATTQSPFAGSASIVRATVTLAGVPVADGGSVQLTTDLGIFEENGLNTISKTTSGGVADVTVFSSNTGTAHVKAVYSCATGQIDLQFAGVPDTGPFIASLSPATGSCAGGDTVTLLGGRFGNGTNLSVFFGGAAAQIVSAGNTQIVVTTPARTLKNPAVPETVNVVVVANGATSAPFLFTYACINATQKVSIASLSPTAGSPAGGDAVAILGSHFGSNIATTQVTFCGRPAQIVQQSDQQINVTTPSHTLANAALSETCDVSVTRDIGLVSQNTATDPQAFTYRGNGSGSTCNTDPTFFISNLAPNTGPPSGGTVVTLTGTGFGTSASLMRVDFGGTPATIVSVSNTSIQVSTPIRTLANSSNPETVDVTVTDLGSPVQRCARVVSGFTYTGVILVPTIFSSSPKTGPNDSTTRVSIFGTGFQFPMQVFLTGGGCGAQRVEASVASILPTTIVFNTPAAVGGNVCLSSQLVDIVIVNPSTNQTATCPACFKYYACPTITTIGPNIGIYNAFTQVVINGHNFEDPAVVSGGTMAWTPVSVSSEQIIATAPPVVVAGCNDISSPVLVNGSSLACPNAQGPIFTYYVKSVSPSVTSIVPNQLPQSSIFPVPVTVTGNNFIDVNMRFVLKMPSGGAVTVFPQQPHTSTQMTFNAPALSGAYQTAACVTGGGASGVQNIPTTVELDVVNGTTTCAAVEQLIYIPTDQSCRVAAAPVTIASGAPPAGTNGSPYLFTFTATGGTPGYTWQITSGTLPTALTLNTGTGTVSGTLTSGVTGTFNFVIKVTDSVGGNASAAVSITVN